MYKDFNSYFSAVKRENRNRYSCEELEDNMQYFKSCWESNLSTYKSLEFFWFEINEDI